MTELPGWIKTVARNYGDGDYAHVADWSLEQLDEALKGDPASEFGDTLFVFLLIELQEKEGCDSWEEAERRVQMARRQLESLAMAIVQEEPDEIPF